MWAWASRRSVDPGASTTPVFNRPTRSLPRISPMRRAINLAPNNSSQVQYTLPKACGHTQCQLTTSEACCVCLDRRPLNSRGYMHYVDGQGSLAGASRAANYCPHCRQNAPSSFQASGQRRQDNTQYPAAAASTPVISEVRAALPSQPSPFNSASSRKTCGHNYCGLSIPTCCACTDRRPLTASYPQYIDGQGLTSTGRRWSTYCPPCRDYHNAPRHEEGTMRLTAQELSETDRRMLARAFGGTADVAANPDYTSPREEMFRASIPTPAPAPVDVNLNDTRAPPSNPVHIVYIPYKPDDSETGGQIDENLCKICFIAPQDALFLPCAHLVSCASCAVLILTHNAPSSDPRHGEIGGQELVGRAWSSLDQQPGQLSYNGLSVMTQPGRSQRRAVCPVCRDSVTRWIKVYRS